MPALKLKRIRCGEGNASTQLARLRDQFSQQGDIVSPASRKLTQAVFGEALSPAKVVERVCADVRERGWPAVQHYTEQFDKVKLTPSLLRVPEKELVAAHAAADPEFIEVLRRVRLNIMAFQTGVLNSDAVLSVSGQHELQMRYRPLRRVGICVPGGRAAYPSTLLMTAVPAQAAGVKELVVVLPPTPHGAANPDMLAVCHELGISEVYRIGGAQAVATLAYGIDGLPAVDMIVGPGNIFVALAKRYVFGSVAIDCIAGPSEIIVVADGSAQPDYVAIDMLAQAEHDPGVAILVTWHEPLLDEVVESLEKQLKKLERADAARDCIERYGAMILTRDLDEAVKVVNDLATEHLHIQTRDPEPFAERIEHAGAIFLGPFSPVAVGDYAAGPSHVLPTGRTARFSSGLSANDFLRRTTMISFTRNGLKDIADEVLMLANKEGLTAHAASVAQRVGDTLHPPRPPRKSKSETKK